MLSLVVLANSIKKLIVFWVGNFQCYHVILRDFTCIGLVD